MNTPCIYRPALRNIYMLEFHPSLSIASRVPEALKYALQVSVKYALQVSVKYALQVSDASGSKAKAVEMNFWAIIQRSMDMLYSVIVVISDYCIQ